MTDVQETQTDGDARFAAMLRRVLARASGKNATQCVACGVAFVVTPMGAEHPDNGCVGPQPVCDVCGASFVWSGNNWKPVCTPVEHATLLAQRRARATANTSADRAPDMMRPSRVRDDDD
jgi:hypothetical protein